MTTAKKQKPHPTGDDRYKAIDRTMKLFRYEKDALLEVLNTAQETFGYLSEELLTYVAQHLNLPVSQAYGVATFYHLFTFEPLGEHNCVVCAGTACYVKGSEHITDALTKAYNIAPGETTPDGKFSLSIARCLGSCGLAPVIVLDGAVLGKETPESTVQKVEAILSPADTAPQEA